MLDIQGRWQAFYSPLMDEAEGNEEHLFAELLLQNGVITGEDVSGAPYSGNYTLSGDDLSVRVRVERGEFDTIFEHLDFPLDVELSGHYISPDFFSATGTVNETHSLAVNCRRIADSE